VTLDGKPQGEASGSCFVTKHAVRVLTLPERFNGESD
jgi:hypothetical protein